MKTKKFILSNIKLLGIKYSGVERFWKSFIDDEIRN
jgi:hypothetical protein